MENYSKNNTESVTSDEMKFNTITVFQPKLLKCKSLNRTNNTMNIKSNLGKTHDKITKSAFNQTNFKKEDKIDKKNYENSSNYIF